MTKAAEIIKRHRRLLRMVGCARNHTVSYPHDGTWRTTITDVLASDRALRKCYASTGVVDGQVLKHDLRFLAGDGYIDFSTSTGPADVDGGVNDGPPETWLVVLTPKGLRHLVDIEKSSIRRLYEKNPPAWWMVGLILLSVIIASIAILKSFGWI